MQMEMHISQVDTMYCKIIYLDRYEAGVGSIDKNSKHIQRLKLESQ